jgi:hypothetical protein
MKATFLETNALSGVAWEAAKRSGDDADQALVALLFACASVESVLNHVLYELRTVSSEHLQEGYDQVATLALEAGLQDDRVSWDRKVRVLALGATGRAVDLGRSPFQEFALIVRLRNWIVHLQPQEVMVKYDSLDSPNRLVAEEPHKLVRALVDRGVVRREGAGPSLVMAIRNPAVARWSYVVMYEVLQSIASWFPAWERLLIGGHARSKAQWSLPDSPRPTSGGTNAS